MLTDSATGPDQVHAVGLGLVEPVSGARSSALCPRAAQLRGQFTPACWASGAPPLHPGPTATRGHHLAQQDPRLCVNSVTAPPYFIYGAPHVPRRSTVVLHTSLVRASRSFHGCLACVRDKHLTPCNTDTVWLTAWPAQTAWQQHGPLEEAGVPLVCSQAYLLASHSGPDLEKPGRAELGLPGRGLWGVGWVTVSAPPLLLLAEWKLPTGPLLCSVTGRVKDSWLPSSLSFGSLLVPSSWVWIRAAGRGRAVRGELRGAFRGVSCNSITTSHSWVCRQVQIHLNRGQQTCGDSQKAGAGRERGRDPTTPRFAGTPVGTPRRRVADSPAPGLRLFPYNGCNKAYTATVTLWKQFTEQNMWP